MREEQKIKRLNLTNAIISREKSAIEAINKNDSVKKLESDFGLLIQKV